MIVNQKSLYYLRVTIDLILLNFSFIAAAVFAQSIDVLVSQNYMLIMEIALNILWIFATNITNFYDDFNIRNFPFQFITVIKNVVVQALGAIFFIFLFKELLFTRNFILYYSCFLFFLAITRSVAFHKILKAIRKTGKNTRNIVIIGAGDMALNFEKIVENNPDFGYKFTGFVTTDNNEADAGIIGNVEYLETVFAENKIDEAVIALPNYNSGLLDKIIKVCNINAVRTHIIPDYSRFMSKKYQITALGDFPVITLRREPLDEVQWRFIKRAFDIFFSLFIMIFLLSWLLPLISLLIRLQSKGKAIYVQDRIGVKNEKFKCYKFRSMYESREEIKFIATSKDDPRITSLGKYLRKFNIDELPQFINVLKGDMSIVGPRPHAVPYNEKYGKIVEEIKMRHNVKPGITGWAQIHGLRGDVEDEEENIRRTAKRIEYDLWYIENWSLGLDIQIIFLTIWQMVRGKAKGI